VIPQRSISILSNRLAKQDGRRIREDVFERDYCVAWFLAALADSDLRTRLALKGKLQGAVIPAPGKEVVRTPFGACPIKSGGAAAFPWVALASACDVCDCWAAPLERGLGVLTRSRHESQTC
jgi:hypothetical protein